MRQYGRDRLADDGDTDRCRDRHRDWALPWAVGAAKVLGNDGQASSLDLIDQEFDNVEAALEWSAADPDRAALALEPILALNDFWLARGTRRAQGVHWSLAICEAAINVAPAVRVRAMAKANVIIGQSDLAAAARIADAAQTLAASAPGNQRAAAVRDAGPLLDGYRDGRTALVRAADGGRDAGTGRPGPSLDRLQPEQLPRIQG